MEIVLTMMFLFTIMGATHGKAPAGFAPIAIGLALTLIHLISIPVTNTSVSHAQHRAGAFCWRLGVGAALTVLGCAADRRSRRRDALPVDWCGTIGGGNCQQLPYGSYASRRVHNACFSVAVGRKAE
jgi:glycerol uptake facilitator-like aquaporin